MTRPDDELERRLDRAELEPSPEEAAVDAYRAKFGTTPWMWDIPPDRMEAWLEAIHQATRTGRPLGEADMKRVLGFGYPPPGALA